MHADLPMTLPRPAAAGDFLLDVVGWIPMNKLVAVLSAFMIALIVLGPRPALAHPHVWASMTAEVVFAPDGSVTGVRHAWTFDDLYSTFATMGIEAKQKG